MLCSDEGRWLDVDDGYAAFGQDPAGYRSLTVAIAPNQVNLEWHSSDLSLRA